MVNAKSVFAHFASLFIARPDDYAIQAPHGLYRRAGHAVTQDVLRRHVGGQQTIGTYVMNTGGECTYAVMDADKPGGLELLARTQQVLASDGIVSYLEQSRREGHLWIFLCRPAPAATVRWWLRPYCPEGMEFFPKQDQTDGYGSLIRVPLGVHQITGKRYPFITYHRGIITPVAPSLHSMLEWLHTIERVEAPTFDVAPPRSTTTTHGAVNQKRSMTISSPHSLRSPQATISTWCAQQDPFSLIGRYVDLNQHGLGHCPFGDHHAHGEDRRRSFKVFEPATSGGASWHCYSWGKGGSVFDFLRLYYDLEPRDLWQRICGGAHF